MAFRLIGRAVLITSLCLAGATLSSCASYIASRNAVWQSQHPPAAANPVDPARQAVVASATSLLGQRPDARVTVRDKAFMLDCIGTVSAAWWGAGFDIQRDFIRFDGNGVKRLYDSSRAWGVLHRHATPKPGDIVFWENTYDRNENGIRYDDGLTHAGIVIAVESDGTVQYLHESETRGVTMAYCNLLHPTEAFGPGGKVWNSPMYLGSGNGRSGNPPRWLSGELWSAFADAEAMAEILR